MINLDDVFMLYFKSDKPIVPIQMYSYSLDLSNAEREISTEIFFNSMCNFLNSIHNCDYLAVHDGEKICTMRPVQAVHFRKSCVKENHKTQMTLIPMWEEKKIIPLEQKTIYEKIIERTVKSHLFGVDADKTRKKYQEYEDKVSTEFFSDGQQATQTVLDCWRNNENIDGIEARFRLDHITRRSASGKVSTQIPSDTPPQYATVSGLLKYYKDTYGYVVRHEKDDFVVMLHPEKKTASSYLASQLQPIYAFESLKRKYPNYKHYDDIFKHIRIPMKERARDAISLMKDISTLDELGGVCILKDIINTKEYPKIFNAVHCGFHCEMLPDPVLRVGNGKTISGNYNGKKEANLFAKYPGFYSLPKLMQGDGSVRIAVASMTEHPIPQGNLLPFVGRLLEKTLGKLRTNTQFIMEYVLYDQKSEISEFDFATRIKKEINPNLVIGCIDDKRGSKSKDDTNEYNLYPEMKEALGDNNIKIPSQMFTSERFNKWNDFYGANLGLGFLGKLGGTPYVLNENPWDIDLYIGIDVGMREKGNHVPCAASAFTGCGGYIGVMAPREATTGEKIPENVLKKLFDKIISCYHTLSKNLPKRVVIHRDGIFREDKEWVRQYFQKHSIQYQVVEIRKSGADRFGIKTEPEYNPPPGLALFHKNQDKSFLVSSIAISGGAPSPIQVCLVDGNLGLSIRDITTQVYWLTKISASSFHDTRLPVTIRYADCISKHPSYIPLGEIVFQKYFI